MKLFYKLNDNYNQNDIVKYNDNSFGARNVFFDFQIFLSSSRTITLNFDTYSQKCVSCEGYLLLNKKLKYENIKIDNYMNGELKIELSEIEKERTCAEYLLDETIIFDHLNSRVCFGRITDCLIRFGKSQYASFFNGKLIGIILEFSSISN